VAVSSLAAGLLTAPSRAGRVLAVFPTAVYLALERHDEVLPLLAHDALLLPTGVRLAAPACDVAWGVVPGQYVRVGDGRVDLPARSLVGVRTWVPAWVDGPVVGATPSAWEPARDLFAQHCGGAPLRALCADLAAAALTGRDVRPALLGLVGAGPGLTPSGDDAVCGLLLTLRAGCPVDDRRLRGALSEALPRTTSLSASLLSAAAQGYAVPQVTRLLRAAARGDARALARHLPPVLAVGHSSGRDLLTGVLGALDALLDHPSPPRNQTPTEGARRG
jgi:hypothetical protein